jgi:RNA ligase (TIGR02306 family)
MSSFSVPIFKVGSVLPHPNADKLELVNYMGYTCIVVKDTIKQDDLVAYIPEASIVPEYILDSLGLKGSSKLSGKDHNRVKAISLRGIFSQGLIYKPDVPVVEGEDASTKLGITKYIPEVPVSLKGACKGLGLHATLKYDIENIKHYPEGIVKGTEVFCTEKIHGTFTQFGLHKEALSDENNFIVTSKGLASRGLVLKRDEENRNNLYVKMFEQLDMESKLLKLQQHLNTNLNVYILGEIFGPGVQDLNYGSAVQFRCFDMYVGSPGKGRYLNLDELLEASCVLGLQNPPLVYHGPYDYDLIVNMTDGCGKPPLEAVSGSSKHVREGLVVRTVIESKANNLPFRAQLKSVSKHYLLRGKDSNTTEFE